MDAIAFFTFLRKRVISALPLKSLQRHCINALQALLFPEKLEDRRIRAEEAAERGQAEKRLLFPARPSPAARIISEPGVPVPEVFLMPETLCPPLYEYIFEGGHCFRTFALDKDLQFIEDATPPRLFQTDLYKRTREIRAGRPRFIKGRAIALNTGHTDNYYHWFTDLVGRMLLMPDWKDALICTDTRFPFQRQCLRLMGIPEERVVAINDYTLYQFERLSLVSAPVLPSCPASYEAVRSFGQSVFGRRPPEPDLPRRIYISRSDAPGRRGVANEKELAPVLEEFGFSVLAFSAIPVERQIALMQNLECLVFPHGAGGANLLFAPPGVRFLEIISPVYHDAGYVRFSKCMDMRHYLLMGESPSGDSKQAAYRVDPNRLRLMLERLVCS